MCSRSSWCGDGTDSPGGEGLLGVEAGEGLSGVAVDTTGVLGGSRAVASLAVKLVWVPGPASVFMVGSQHHSSLRGDSTFILTPSYLSGPQGEKGKGTGQLPAEVTEVTAPQGNMTLLAT